ncbi:transcriptional regulator BetI [Burkholderia pseudomultivorans]|uniref:HTH-type transcriptional regulator BetI n=1 Tax=Burkholderia pseudomultivorans TaxID=1207504 RepID=A0ABU2E3L3_9BURK|nr:transcriptional regulator BetI [Burkholderia pseudomultivorans]MDR8729635.1 HTH-type transcriptional regulator BetI [Burkholderia pseudomultivorans]MDR8737028.1 HTH-type transcriptional regulator BetI [Burkholderia pseudomultivorans]MDR8743077.1 HTH-type transcriptional regulator BetI [Burkholderia pseudomultivorans]MDR8754452.1 HTH-type transcriptional regulator BetI [Burkholderia pseudomultivorans]MDR8779805.1 HTH-type transcriptional regulator BetI [Burkholderia pseudomultivorans]
MTTANTKKPTRASKTTARVRSREEPEVRRKAMIQATMRAIAKYGYVGTTVDSICAEAQVSRGMINHHFKTKEELLRLSYKALCDEWEFQTQQMVMSTYSDPEERLRALIRVSFGPTLFKADYLGIWVGYWSVIGKSPALRRLHRETYNYDRTLYQTLFEEAGKQRGRVVNARRAAISLIGLIDGLWLEWGLDPKGFSPKEAEEACIDFVEMTLR